jgi:plastocyanin
VRAPGTNDEHKNGDTCPDGQEGFVQVFVNGQKLDNFTKYIPQDTDEVQIIFGPEQEAAVNTGNVIPEGEATRELEIEMTDEGNPTADATTTPAELTMETGEAVKIVIKNTGTVSHGLRVAGADQIFSNDDDFVSDTIGPDEEGFVVVRFNDPGEYQFRNANFAERGLGTITVTGDPVQPINLTITDGGQASTATFDPSSINVVVGKAVKLVVKNDGQLTHGISIPGDDGELGTPDDITTGVLNPDESGEMTFVPDELGEITFVDIQDVTGTIVVTEAPDPDASPTPTPGPGEGPVDTELEVGVTTEGGFDPAELTVGAGETFRIKLTADDKFTHNMRIDGPDGEFNTDDDLLTAEDAIDGSTANLNGEIAEAGTYSFRDDFHPELTGTLTVE